MGTNVLEKPVSASMVGKSDKWGKTMRGTEDADRGHNWMWGNCGPKERLFYLYGGDKQDI